jgi:nucleoid DNA-binding protein
MNKTEFIDEVAVKTGLSKKDAKGAVDAVLEVITEALVKKDSVSFIGFGTFSTAERAARVAKVPGTDNLKNTIQSIRYAVKMGAHIINYSGGGTEYSQEEFEAVKAAEAEKDAALYRTHFAFPADLSLYLDAKQIDAVKDGMTYGVVMVTYKATVDMIPTLKEEEKAQIMAWLVEAREFAMDAENSNKKHAAFGKYKGRINNYLSKRGYDLVKERKAWYERIKARGGKI